MIRSLVQSAFQTGCLSVASEGLIRQVLVFKVYQSGDLEFLNTLYQAVNAGEIETEGRMRQKINQYRYQNSQLV